MERKKATIRFTDQQWKQIREHLYLEETTLQALVLASLADKLPKFDV